MPHHTKHRRWMIASGVIILALSIATPVLAEYIGPNRTRTETVTSCRIVLNECQFVEAKGEWKYKGVDTWACSNEGKPWREYSSNARPCNDLLHTNGYQYWSREEDTDTEIVTYPPATISSSLQSCTLRNGWCITVPQLSLTGSEPVAGHSIIAIEGTRNGQTFACTSATCSVPLIQGNNNFTYWALSSFEDSSTMGTLTAKVDSDLPSVTGTISGTLGLNGWYRSAVTFNNSASDAASGLASFTCTLDNLPLGSCNNVIVNSEGVHTLVLTARDHAGHVRTLSRNASIDTQNPSLSASINGTLGSPSWYTAATLYATAADASPGSGLAVLEYNVDGSGWTAFPASGVLDLTDGQHTVDLRAVDKVGRIASSSKSFSLDTIPPTLTTDSAGTTGQNDWYTTRPILSASASDNTSGLKSLEYSLNNSDWSPYTTSLSLDEGVHNVSFWAEDQAGWVTQVDRTYRVDTRAPQIAGNLSGSPGMNDWYISDVTIFASAADPLPGSDVDAFTYILDGGEETPYTDPLTLSDGQHTVQFNARDKAGLSYSIAQTFNIDTTLPSLAIDSALPDWVRGPITISGAASDNGSGLSDVEISLDGGQSWQAVTDTDSWAYTWNTLESSNGVHNLSLRAADRAGLMAQQALNVGVDNLSPEITLPDSWLQWDTVTLNVSDEHSGLSEVSVEISDPEGRWPKRVIQLDTAQFPLELKWDRRFEDGTVADAGNYDVKVFASDELGNSADKSASIRVLLDILPPGPTSTSQPVTPTEIALTPVNTSTAVFSPTATPIYTASLISSPTTTPQKTATPPSSVSSPTTTPQKTATPPSSVTATPTAIVRAFGTLGPTAQASPTPAASPTPRATPTQVTAVDWLQSIFEPDTYEENVIEIGLEPTEESPQPTSNSVLWGTAAAAAIGAATAYAQEENRKREEEKARQKALEERRKKMKQKKLAKMEAKRAQEAAWEAARLEQLHGGHPAHIDMKIAHQEYEEGIQNSLKTPPPVKKVPYSNSASQDRRAERKDELVQEEINAHSAEPQDWKADYDSYMAQKAQEEAAKKKQEASAPPPKKKNWWEKAVDWVDAHQTEIALSIGVAAGVTAVVLSGGLALPAVLAVTGGAMLAAGGTAAAMTFGLNTYYDRPWHENLFRNFRFAGGAALVTAAIGFAFNTAVLKGTAYCSTNPASCGLIAPIFKGMDIVEETWLKGKLAFQTWKGDQAGAAETAFELHSESVDGGMPGNSVVKELGDQFSHLSKKAVPLIRDFGFDVIPLLVKYGDEGLEIIQKYGNDGFALLQKYGDDGYASLQKYGNSAINLINSYGDSAIKVMKAVDPAAGKKLLQSLDDDVLDYAIEQGPEAVEALSKWSPKDLRLHGPELVLRAEKDAKALDAVKKLTSSGPIDPKNLTEAQKKLIDQIAENSTHYAENGQVVLGKWVDLDGGFVQTAQDTGSIHYNPHPDMWNSLEGLGKETQEEVAWLINKQVVQTGIEKGKPFEYTLNGIPTDVVSKEQAAIRAIFSGKSDEEIMKVLKSEYMPIRMKELQELQKAGYKYTFDSVSKSYILIKK